MEKENILLDPYLSDPAEHRGLDHALDVQIRQRSATWSSVSAMPVAASPVAASAGDRSASSGALEESVNDWRALDGSPLPRTSSIVRR